MGFGKYFIGIFFVSAALILACSSNSDSDADGDGKPDPNNNDEPTCIECIPFDVTGPLDFESVTTTSRWNGVHRQKVTYLSDDLLIFGQICRPDRDDKFPVLVLNHGGAEGLGGEWGGGLCGDMARQGFAVVESSYRGEDGSEGDIEVSLGEVDDVLRILQIALEQEWADKTRVAMVGLSHGGGITARAIERGAPVHVAVDIFGPSDWVNIYRYWEKQLDEGPLLAPRGPLQSLLDLLDDKIGDPDIAPDQYAARSPIHFSEGLTKYPGAFMIVQGSDDELVPPSEACDLAAAAGGFLAYRHNSLGDITPEPPAACLDHDLAWVDDSVFPRDWPDDRYLLFFDGMNHSAEKGAGLTAIFSIINFVKSRLDF